MTISNNPPSMAEIACETMQAISDWMKEHPVIGDEDAAREAKVMIDRGKLCIKDLEDERTKAVKPLNEKVAEINEGYRGPRENLRKVIEEISRRITAFIAEEERKRIALAVEAAQKLDEAERAAEQARNAQRHAADLADGGVLDVDTAASVVEAAAAERALVKAQREAARAEKETNVRVGGGFTRAIGLRTEITLEVVEPYHAIEVMGLTPDIEEAIIKSARAYHRLHKEYPAGIRATEERKAK